MDTHNTKRIAEALRETSAVLIDALYDMSKSDSLIQADNKGKATSHALWSKKCMEIDNLSDAEKEWLDDYSNYVLPGLHWRIRDFIGEGIRYYCGKADREASRDRLHREIKDLKEQVRIAEDKVTGLTEIVAGHVENEAKLYAELSHLRECNDNQRGNLEAFQADMKGTLATLDTFRSYATYVEEWKKNTGGAGLETLDQWNDHD